MRISFPALMSDAWRLWRGDWEILTAVAGAFSFLPGLAAAMLIPDLPRPQQGVDLAPGSAALDAYQQSVAAWMGQNGVWWLAVAAIGAFGQFALVALYLSGDRPSVGEALAAAARRFPMLILAGLMLLVPLLALALVVYVVPLLATAFFVVLFWLWTRLVALAPVLLAEPPIGPARAMVRSFHLTRGSTFAIAAALMTVILIQQIAILPFAMLDAWMVANAPNPIARSIVDAIAALIGAAGAIATALLQVAAYRRLRTR